MQLAGASGAKQMLSPDSMEQLVLPMQLELLVLLAQLDPLARLDPLDQLDLSDLPVLMAPPDLTELPVQQVCICNHLCKYLW